MELLPWVDREVIDRGKKSHTHTFPLLLYTPEIVTPALQRREKRTVITIFFRKKGLTNDRHNRSQLLVLYHSNLIISKRQRRRSRWFKMNSERLDDTITDNRKG